MEIAKVYPLDAVFDNPEDVPEDVNKRHSFFFKNKDAKYMHVIIYILILFFFFLII